MTSSEYRRKSLKAYVEMTKALHIGRKAESTVIARMMPVAGKRLWRHISLQNCFT
jgi:hypothetical protein